MIQLNPEKNDASCALDLMRAVAAQAVCIGHAASFFGATTISPAFYIQNVGVLLFFLLSGLLIAYTLTVRSRDPSYGFARYSIDRVARIHSGIVPALLFICLVDGLLLWHGLYDHTSYFTVRAFFANVFMFQGYRGIFENWLIFPSFGSAGPLWTLAIEFHIYLAVGAIFFLIKGSRWWPILIPVGLFFLQLPLMYLYGSVQPGVGTGVFSLWLAGFALAFLLPVLRAPVFVAVGIAVVMGWLFLRSLVQAQEYDMRFYPLLVISFAAIISASLQTQITFQTPFAKVVRFFADYSYMLYLIHYTLLNGLKKVWPADQGLSGALVGIFLANIIAVSIALFTEMKHKQLAGFLAKLFLSSRTTRNS